MTACIDLWLQAHPRIIGNEAEQDLRTGVRMAIAAAEEEAFAEGRRSILQEEAFDDAAG